MGSKSKLLSRADQRHLNDSYIELMRIVVQHKKLRPFNLTMLRKQREEQVNIRKHEHNEGDLLTPAHIAFEIDNLWFAQLIRGYNNRYSISDEQLVPLNDKGGILKHHRDPDAFLRSLSETKQRSLIAGVGEGAKATWAFHSFAKDCPLQRIYNELVTAKSAGLRSRAANRNMSAVITTQITTEEFTKRMIADSDKHQERLRGAPAKQMFEERTQIAFNFGEPDITSLNGTND